MAILDFSTICRFFYFGSPKDFHNFLSIGEYRSFLSIKEYKDNFGSKQWDNISKHRANTAKILYLCFTRHLQQCCPTQAEGDCCCAFSAPAAADCSSARLRIPDRTCVRWLRFPMNAVCQPSCCYRRRSQVRISCYRRRLRFRTSCYRRRLRVRTFCYRRRRRVQ